jgi:hypothetical protein
MNIEARGLVTIGGNIRVVDAADEDAPLLTCDFYNEWGGRFRALSEPSKLILVEAISAVVSKTFKDYV